MWKRSAGVWAIAAGVILLLGIGVVRAQTRTISHTAVTTYTDGSAIEPGNTVTYSVWMQDNVSKVITQVSNRVTQTAHPFEDAQLVKGRVYNFWGQAHLASGASSDNSATYSWTVPLGKAGVFQWVGVQ